MSQSQAERYQTWLGEKNPKGSQSQQKEVQKRGKRKDFIG